MENTYFVVQPSPNIDTPVNVSVSLRESLLVMAMSGSRYGELLSCLKLANFKDESVCKLNNYIVRVQVEQLFTTSTYNCLSTALSEVIQIFPHFLALHKSNAMRNCEILQFALAQIPDRFHSAAIDCVSTDFYTKLKEKK